MFEFAYSFFLDWLFELKSDQVVWRFAFALTHASIRALDLAL